MGKTGKKPYSRRVFEIIEVGAPENRPSRIYDAVNLITIVINLAASIMFTFDPLRERFGPVLLAAEGITITFFAVDYALRLWTARYLFPRVSSARAVFKYVFSFSGIVDLLSFLPYYLPVVFPMGAAAFRIFRMMRFFRLFRINAYYDALKVITEVLTSKSQQIISSVFIILVLMIASSLVMYSLEHEAQPEVFANAFSGIWWAASTLLTVGYGDIYPITTAGKVFGIFSTVLGVGMVAIPTGIISAGFVEQYSRIKQSAEYAREEELPFIRVRLAARDGWAGKTIRELDLPAGMLAAAVRRGEKTLLPQEDFTLRGGDTVVLCAGPCAQDGSRIELKELALQAHHPWNGRRIRELDISRRTMIAAVKRKGRALSPGGELKLQAGDVVTLYSCRYTGDGGGMPL